MELINSLSKEYSPSNNHNLKTVLRAIKTVQGYRFMITVRVGRSNITLLAGPHMCSLYLFSIHYAICWEAAQVLMDAVADLSNKNNFDAYDAIDYRRAYFEAVLKQTDKLGGMNLPGLDGPEFTSSGLKSVLRTLEFSQASKAGPDRSPSGGLYLDLLRQFFSSRDLAFPPDSTQDD